jgi:hypothetical protein
MDFNQQQLGTPVIVPSEQRHDPRYTVQAQIELREEGSDVPLRMNTTDLSRGGCYVELMMTLPIGTNLTGTLWLSGRSVRIKGRVVTRHPQFGNGIKFLELEDHGDIVLAQYLEAICAELA